MIDDSKTEGTNKDPFEKFGPTRDDLQKENCRLTGKLRQVQEDNARIEDHLHGDAAQVRAPQRPAPIHGRRVHQGRAWHHPGKHHRHAGQEGGADES